MTSKKSPLQDSTRYNVDGGLWEYPLNGRMRKFQFGRLEAMDFSRRMGQDPMSFLIGGRGDDVFLVEAIRSSLLKDKSFNAEAPDDEAILEMLDKNDDLEPDHDEDLMKFAFVFLYALGRPRKQRKRAIDTAQKLWERFAAKSEDWEGVENPFLKRSSKQSSETSSSNGPPSVASFPGKVDAPAPTES